MNRAKLLWNIEAYKKGRITDEQIVADVDAYSSAYYSNTMLVGEANSCRLLMLK